MVIGMARGSLGRVFDAYTRDRSTPHPDAFFGGSDDLTAALAYEEDGETVVAFRRRLSSSDPADHGIEPGRLMQLIWAHGQDADMYSHIPLSGLERGPDPSIPDFYREDELKYHGKENRGVDTIDFLGEKNK